MDKVVNKTVGVLTRLGERIERTLSIDEERLSPPPESRSYSVFPSSHSAFQRPLDRKKSKYNTYSSERRNLAYGGAKRQSFDNIAASPGYLNNKYSKDPRTTSTFNTYTTEWPYGTDFGGSTSYNPFFSPNVQMGNMPYGVNPGSVGYAPDYYVAERRQIELVPAPPPRVIPQPVPVPMPVDRPVPQPYPVAVPTPVAVDRPVPVAVPMPVPVDRYIPVPVPSQPLCVPVPVPVSNPVPCYVPVGVPVPSPVPSPVMFEQSVSHVQRWVTGSPVMMNQPRFLAGSPVMGMNPIMPLSSFSFSR